MLMCVVFKCACNHGDVLLAYKFGSHWHHNTSCVLINANNNISTTIHAMTVLSVPFCPAQDGESTDIKLFSVLRRLQKITKFW